MNTRSKEKTPPHTDEIASVSKDQVKVGREEMKVSEIE